MYYTLVTDSGYANYPNLTVWDTKDNALKHGVMVMLDSLHEFALMLEDLDTLNKHLEKQDYASVLSTFNELVMNGSGCDLQINVDRIPDVSASGVMHLDKNLGASLSAFQNKHKKMQAEDRDEKRNRGKEL